MRRVFWAALAGAMLLISIPVPAQNDDDSMQQLQQCREITNVEERVACYDRIGDPTPVSNEPTVAAEMETAAPVANEPTVQAETAAAAAGVAAADVPQEIEPASENPEPSDDFGLPKAEEDLRSITATIARCGEANNRRFYFYLNNGQAWEYIGGNKLRYKSCDFPATLTEDGFGFSLRMEGRPSLRVRRVK